MVANLAIGAAMNFISGPFAVCLFANHDIFVLFFCFFHHKTVLTSGSSSTLWRSKYAFINLEVVDHTFEIGEGARLVGDKHKLGYIIS
jgi:hypothetical protein